jgi:hypothetical protein
VADNTRPVPAANGFTEREYAQQQAKLVPQEPTSRGVVGVINGVRSVTLPPGVYRTAPQQYTNVQSPYRPLFTSRSSGLMPTADRMADEVERARIEGMNFKARFVSIADRASGDDQPATSGSTSPSLADRFQNKLDYNRSLLTPDEVRRWDEDSIGLANAADQARFDNSQATSRAYSTGNAVVDSVLRAQFEGIADRNIATANDPATPSPLVVGPYASQESRAQWIASTHPELFTVVADILGNSRRPAADIAKVTNIALANDAAEEIIASGSNPIRQQQILAAQGSDSQAALTIAVLTQKVKDNQARAAEADTTNPNWFAQQFSGVVSWLMETALPALGTVAATIPRAAQTAGNLVDESYDREYYDGMDNPLDFAWKWTQQFRDAWNNTRPGYFKQADVAKLQEKHGASGVNLVLEAIALRNLGEDDVVGTLYELHQENPEALSLLDAIFFSREVSPEISDLVQEVISYDSGNLASDTLKKMGRTLGDGGLLGKGDMIPVIIMDDLVLGAANSVFPEGRRPVDYGEEIWKAPGYGQTRDALNVSGWIILDPFIVGGKVLRVAKYARMGLHHLAPGKIDKAFEMKTVRRYWDDLGNRLREADKLSSGTERRAARRSIARQEKKWFPPEVIESLSKSKVYSADDALEWFREIDNLNRVLAGQPARRAWQQYIPHASFISPSRKQFSLALRAMDPTMKIVDRAAASDGGLASFKQSFDDVLGQAETVVNGKTGQSSLLNGRRYDDLTDEEAASLITKIATDADGGAMLGSWLTNVTGDRTWASKVVKRLTSGNGKSSRYLARKLDRYAFKRRKDPRSAIDALSRAGAIVPDFRSGITVSDGSDAQKVYQQLRVAGFPRWWATEMSELWKVAEEGQRRTMLQGIARTQAYAMGAHLIDPENGVENVVKLVTGYRDGEMYAANMIPGATAKQKEIIEQIRKSSRVLDDETELDEEQVLARITDQFGDEQTSLSRELQAIIDDLDPIKNDGELDALKLQVDELGKASVRSTEELDKEVDRLVAAGLNDEWLPWVEDPAGVSFADALAMFDIPPSKEYVKAALNWSKSKQFNNTWTAKGYTVKADAEKGFIVLSKDGAEIGSAPTVREAKRLAEIDSGSTVRRGGGEVSPKVRAMLEKGYLPYRWAEYNAAQAKVGSRTDEAYAYLDDVSGGTNAKFEGDQERQAALWLGASSLDEVANFDWYDALSQAVTFGKSKEKWVPIPWMAGYRDRVSRQIVDETSKAYDIAKGELDMYLAHIAGEEAKIAAFAERGVKPYKELASTYKSDTVALTDEQVFEKAQVQWNAWLSQQMPHSPSMGIDGQQAGVFAGQMKSRVAFPSLTQLEPFMAHRNFLAALLGNNRGVQGLTDAWVFMTLAGPRFSIRNALEDWMFWGLTAGSIQGAGGLRSGRRASQGVRQARQIINKDVQAKLDELEKAKIELAEAGATGTVKTPQEISKLGKRIETLEKELEEAAANAGGVRTEKLGIVKTNMRRVGTAIGRRVDESTDSNASLVRALVHPYLAPEEIVSANTAFREGDRTKLGRLFAKAYARERIMFMPASGTLKDWVKARNGDVSVLPAADQVVLRDLEQMAMGRNGFMFMDAVVEEARNMIDGTLPAWNKSADMTVVGDEALQRLFINREYTTMLTQGRSPRAINATWHTLSMALHGDGPKSQAAMFLLPDWMNASAVERSRMVDEVVETMLDADAAENYLQRFSLFSSAGEVDMIKARNLARATLETLEGVFTTKSGGFNQKLWESLKSVGGDSGGLVNFKLWDDALPDQALLAKADLMTDGTERSFRVSKFDFAEGKQELPRTYLSFDGDEVLVPSNGVGGKWQQITDIGWDAMGRSMARLTREPMYMANYLEARQMLRPFEAEWKRIYGDKWWQVADNVATQKAYDLTLSYIDNPAVRSQLAWQVRNVARFYRATEDFFRRSWRLVSNNPMGVYKAAFAINLLDDIGFFERTEEGDYTFVYPVIPSVFEGLSTGLRLLFQPDATGAIDYRVTGRVAGLTPSADMEAWLPTLAGFYSTVPVRTLLAAAPTLDRFLGTDRLFENAAYSAEATLFGQISADSPDKFRSSLPTHLARTYDLFDAIKTGSKGMENFAEGAVANAARSAVVVNVAAGNIKTDGALSDDEYNDTIDLVDHTATELLTLKLLGGFFLPASPQIGGDTVNDLSRYFGMFSLQGEYYKLREQLGDEEAALAWYERHPDKAPFTVSSSGDTGTVGYFQAEKVTEEWLKANEDIRSKFPLGASIIAPRSEDPIFNRTSYNYMRRTGLKPRKTVGDFLRDTAISEGVLAKRVFDQYVDSKRSQIMNSGLSPEAMKEELSRFETETRINMENLYRKYDGLKYRATSRNGNGVSPAQAADSIEGAIRAYMPRTTGAERERLDYMLQIMDRYREAKSIKESGNIGQVGYTQTMDELRGSWKAMMTAAAGYYPDDQFVLFVKTLSAALDWNLEEL